MVNYPNNRAMNDNKNKMIYLDAKIETPGIKIFKSEADRSIALSQNTEFLHSATDLKEGKIGPLIRISYLQIFGVGVVPIDESSEEIPQLTKREEQTVA